MNREEALKKIKSPSSHERFLAIQALQRSALTEDIGLLIATRSIETDAVVLSRLNTAINYIADCTSDVSESSPVAPETEEAILARAHATDWIAGMLLHEVGSKLGLVALAASREIPGYEFSKTKRHIRNFQQIFAAIEQLRSATILPRFEQFDLAELISEVTAIELETNETPTSLVGIRPLLVSSDRNLLRLALCNGMRNAIEACIDMKDRDKTKSVYEKEIVINWGASDLDYWIVIIDNGPGLTGPSGPAFEIGKSTKGGHPGFGLPIAKQAMETLSGNVKLAQSQSGGAIYEMRWKKIK